MAKLSSAGMSTRTIAQIVDLPKSTVIDFLGKKTYKGWWSKHEGILFGEEEVDERIMPNILMIDIETSPILAYVWGLFKQNVGLNQIKEDWEILCTSFNWFLKSKEVNTITAREYFLGDRNPEIMEQVILSLWSLLENADVIVAHNAVRFDNKKIRAKLVEWGLPPPKPYKVIDTLTISKGQFGFTSNKMDYITKKLGGQGKIDTGGMQLWVDCVENKIPDAWDFMETYCEQDISELINVYRNIRAWDNRHPNLTLFVDDPVGKCPVCLSSNLSQVEGQYTTTNVSKFELFRCGDCGAYRRGATNMVAPQHRRSILRNIP